MTGRIDLHHPSLGERFRLIELKRNNSDDKTYIAMLDQKTNLFYDASAPNLISVKAGLMLAALPFYTIARAVYFVARAFFIDFIIAIIDCSAQFVKRVKQGEFLAAAITELCMDLTVTCIFRFLSNMLELGRTPYVAAKVGFFASQTIFGNPLIGRVNLASAERKWVEKSERPDDIRKAGFPKNWRDPLVLFIGICMQPHGHLHALTSDPSKGRIGMLKYSYKVIEESEGIHYYREMQQLIPRFLHWINHHWSPLYTIASPAECS